MIPIAEKVKKLQSICKVCNHSASFTFRTASSEDRDMIGGQDKYMPLCRVCWHREDKKKKAKELEG